MDLSEWAQHGTTMKLSGNVVVIQLRAISMVGRAVGNQVEVQSQQMAGDSTSVWMRLDAL